MSFLFSLRSLQHLLSDFDLVTLLRHVVSTRHAVSVFNWLRPVPPVGWVNGWLDRGGQGTGQSRSVYSLASIAIDTRLNLSRKTTDRAWLEERFIFNASWWCWCRWDNFKSTSSASGGTRFTTARLKHTVDFIYYSNFDSSQNHHFVCDWLWFWCMVLTCFVIAFQKSHTRLDNEQHDENDNGYGFVERDHHRPNRTLFDDVWSCSTDKFSPKLDKCVFQSKPFQYVQ